MKFRDGPPLDKIYSLRNYGGKTILCFKNGVGYVVYGGRTYPVDGIFSFDKTYRIYENEFRTSPIIKIREVEKIIPNIRKLLREL